MPIRIQRKRTKGWKMPPNTVSITRPGEFGNPFKVNSISDVNMVLGMYEELLKSNPLTEDQISKLKGKDLACFCKEGDPCHGDILLKYANK